MGGGWRCEGYGDGRNSKVWELENGFGIRVGKE